MNNLESLVEWVPRPRQCHPCEQLQNRGNCGCFKPGLTFFQAGADVNAAVAQESAISQPILRQLPPGASPPFLLTYNASSVPILQLGLGGQGLSEQALL